MNIDTIIIYDKDDQEVIFEGAIPKEKTTKELLREQLLQFEQSGIYYCDGKESLSLDEFLERSELIDEAFEITRI